MKEKLLFLGMLVMCALYYIEVLPKGDITVLNWVGFVISAVTIVPWLISILKNQRKKDKKKAAKKEKND